ncbi:MAG TPA: rRNA methyltransferase, partial [Hyphomonadaceae bacterium]|nr:rRNA methyltransferase [Hyphomonadaceae bacterium]
MTKNTPAIILVGPQMGENIGAAARVMGNFGLSDLRIVAPRDGWPNPAAETMSAGAFETGVVTPKVYETLD